MRPRTTMMLTVAFSTALLGCQEKLPEDEDKFIEYVEVTGQCRENHVNVNQSSEYSGSLVHWFNVTKGQHAVYGSVFDETTLDRSLEQVTHPHDYYPPFSVKFDNLTPDQVAQPMFTLSGISCRPREDDCSKPQFKTTCNLKVKRRLDYLPDALTEGKGQKGKFGDNR